MDTSESLPVKLYYDLIGEAEAAARKAISMTTLLQKEMGLFLETLADERGRLAALEAKLKAIQQTYIYAPFTELLYDDYYGELNIDGLRKWEEHTEIKAVITWLQKNGVAIDNDLSEYDYRIVKGAMEEEYERFCYAKAAIDYLQTAIWKLEGRMALAAGYKADTGLRWNLTSKSPFTKTDFENLMSSLWEKKFITHTSGKKEVAMKALYGVFDLPVPEKIGTNRHKAKAAGTTSEGSYEIFDRLKAAHQQYLTTNVR